MIYLHTLKMHAAPLVLAAFGIFFTTQAAAGINWTRLGVSQIAFNNPIPVNDFAYSYDGKARNISRFYEPERPNISMDLYYVRNSSTFLTMHLNTGYTAAKYYQEPSIAVGLTKVKKLLKTQKKELSLRYNIAVNVGGTITHSPCYDIFQREYSCSTLTAWSDFSYKKERLDTIPIYGMSLGYKY